MRRRTTAVLLTLVLAGISPAPATAAPGAPTVPVPAVTGPLPPRPFFASDLDLPARGYVEQEYLYSGHANVYDATVAPGIGARPTPSPTANIVSSGHPYTTRMVVRRPAHPAAFNGTVIVEWLNATSQYDVEAYWFRTHEFLLRDGYAWVGITAQSAPVTHPVLGLKAFDPQRYAALDLPAGDALSFDAYAQGLQAVRRAGVLGGLQNRIGTVIAAGVSQSAGRVSVFVNAVQPRTRPVADAVLLYVGGERLRDDLPIPVFKVLSETEFAAPPASSANEISSLQPDTRRMRTWAVAGTSHSDWASFAVRYALLRRDQPTAPLRDNCARPSRSRIPDRYTLSAATHHLARWARHGTPPPTAPLITLGPDGLTVQRDQHGNALGGLRLAPFQVPVALDTGINENPPGAGGLCFLNGTHLPFDRATLTALYPDRPTYLRQFTAATARNVRDGYVLLPDAAEMLRDAHTSLTGRDLECRELCANVSQFPIQPSTQLLRDHTAFLYQRGGDRLLHTLDDATLAVARGQTDPARQPHHYAVAVRALEDYRDLLERQRRLGRATVEQAALLDGYATELIQRLTPGPPTGHGA
ncbi:alpha/beta hydrolase domain-containing protein [Actinoplanes sp. NPDC049802]|uniref:alpha/beta hydrolase domain-containing protein n=1 Tax=Actinoplanes sp. NPDC049802 TaxID=3154742 RepID=UPI0033E916A0